ncbi:MAG TPA: type II toxin-antitoxin system RatA family toxin [Methylovirgula sp.]|jgi:coenzyme Q-binding protein COQ10|nr:type II toxin-antitoxin system RatA family toxin [Methylovirgula sp.]
MPRFRTKRRVQHAATEMFALVADVEAYPKFLPLCRDLRLRETRETPDGKKVLIADMEVGYKALHETFTSRVTCDPKNLSIQVEYVDGPFKHLENQWRFVETGPHSCAVEFDIAYEFRSRALALVVGGMFDAAFRKFAEAFEQRANVVYGGA